MAERKGESIDMLTAKDIIEKLNLQKLEPEGGYFRRSAEVEEDGQVIANSIYYLLEADDCSAMHRLHADEIYHFYMGDPLELLELRPDGSSKITILGPELDNNMQLQVHIKKQVWQGSVVLKKDYGYSLIATTMCPQFTPEGFELADDSLIIDYPLQKEDILKRTRNRE